jgi:hypothetical protein
LLQLTFLELAMEFDGYDTAWGPLILLLSFKRLTAVSIAVSFISGYAGFNMLSKW